MPFKSESQRRMMWAQHPDIAKRWSSEYPGQGPKNLPSHVDAARRHLKATRQKPQEPR